MASHFVLYECGIIDYEGKLWERHLPGHAVSVLNSLASKATPPESWSCAWKKLLVEDIHGQSSPTQAALKISKLEGKILLKLNKRHVGIPRANLYTKITRTD